MAVTVTTQSSSLHATGNQYGDVHVRDNAVVHMGNNIYRMEVELDQLLILARKADQADQRLQRPLGHQIQPAAPMSAVNSSRLATTAPPALSPSQLCDVGATRAYHPNGPITQSSSQMTAVSALAISHRQVNVCKFLLDMNADPFLEDQSRWSAADNAWDKILGNTFPADVEDALRIMFSETECIERRNFTVLHKIVLGLLDGDLAQRLYQSTADLNAVDSNNRTAVSLAAERGDDGALQALLKYRPDVNISSSCGSSPLHFAACSMNFACIKLLIDAGASVDALTNWDQTPLIYASAYTKDAECAQLLLDAGAKIDHRDRDGITALGWAAITDNLPIASLLIKRGANVPNMDHNGDTFLSICVMSNRAELLTLLRGRELDVSDGPATKKDLLLLAAEHASIETIKALAQISLHGDYGGRSHEGQQWKDLLTSRGDYSEDLAHALEAWVARLQRTESIELDEEEHANEPCDLFEDAVEEQQAVPQANYPLSSF